MTSTPDIEQKLKELEILRIQSEIARNDAQRDSLKKNRWQAWSPYLLAVVIAGASVATFFGFISDLYQIAVTDRDENRRNNLKLTKENEALAKDKERLANSSNSAEDLTKQLASAMETLVAQERQIAAIVALILDANPSLKSRIDDVSKTIVPVELTENELQTAILVIRWNDHPNEAFAVSLQGPRKNTNGERLAQGVLLGGTYADSMIRGGWEWDGRWSLVRGRIRMVESYPRPVERRSVVEVDLTKRGPGGRWPATRTNEGVTEAGIAEVHLPKQGRP
jgi:hypothetical protein